MTGAPDIIRYFEYQHLPSHLAAVSKPFHDLAWDLVNQLDASEELEAGFRKLLEAKDCMVRAALQPRR